MALKATVEIEEFHVVGWVEKIGRVINFASCVTVKRVWIYAFLMSYYSVYVGSG
jgi:hypothetical protein